MRLYHKDVFMPILELPYGHFLLEHSFHAIMEANADRYGDFQLPRSFNTMDWEVIEVETFDNMQVNKVVYRKSLDNRKDVCIVVLFEKRRKPFLKTAWINLKSDKHRTLNKSRYSRF